MRLVSVTPQDRSFRCLPGFPGFVVCFVWFIASCALHHVIYFLNSTKYWHGPLIHLNRGNSHGDSLYNISSRYLESYSKYSNYLDLPQTHVQFKDSQFFSASSCSSNLAIYSFIFFRSSTKNPNIFGPS